MDESGPVVSGGQRSRSKSLPFLRSASRQGVRVGGAALPFYLAVVATIGSPSSVVFSIPVRDLFLLVSLALLALHVLRTDGPRFRVEISLLVLLVTLAIFVLSTTLLALFNDVPIGLTISEASQFFATALIPAVYLLFLPYVDTARFNRGVVTAFIAGIVVYGAIRVLLSIGAAFFQVNIVDAYKVIFSFNIAPWEFLPGLYRLYSINDLVVVLGFFMALAVRKVSPLVTVFTFILLVVIVLTNASRLTVAYFFICWFAVAFVRRGLLGPVLVLLIMLPIVAIIWDQLVVAFSIRFDPRILAYSDGVRYAQLQELMHMFQSGLPNIIFGNGLGSTTKDFGVEDFGSAYLYEMQWVAFLAKFGLIGITYVAVLFLVPAWRLGSSQLRRDQKLMLLGGYLLFLVSGFTNPYLLSAVSGAFLVFTVALPSNVEAFIPIRSRSESR